MAKQQKKENIPPVRTIEDMVEELQKELSGKDKITRMGERYFMSCHCENFVTTVKETRVTQFMNEHWDNCKEEK